MVVLGAEIHWVVSTLCKVCIQLWHALVAVDFFVDLMFIQMRKSKKKTPLVSIHCDLKIQEMASFSGQHPPGPSYRPMPFAIVGTALPGLCLA